MYLLNLGISGTSLQSKKEVVKGRYSMGAVKVYVSRGGRG